MPNVADQGDREDAELVNVDEESGGDDPLLALVPGVIVEGKYRVDRLLGRGGMGVVVVATHLDLNEQVALKFLQIKDDGLDAETDFRARFALEARVCAKLRNEHIARVHDVGIWQGRIPFMVMDYLEGIDLRRAMKTDGRIGVARAVDYVVQICEGLAEAHAQGIVHRDLKPPNIFITKRKDGSDLVKVLDFGISKWASLGEELGELTKTGVMLGSPKYMSPEQLSCETVDGRSDVWSIGAMLYNMLTGRPPYDFPQVTQTFMAIASGARPARPSTIEPAIPPALDDLIMGCLTRDRDKRIQNVAELAGAALEAIDSPFADQARAVIGAVLEPQGSALGRPRLSMMTPGTGSHAAYTLASDALSVTPGTMTGGVPSAAPAKRSRTKAIWAMSGAVAVLTLVAMVRGPGGTASGFGASGMETARTRGFTTKTLVAAEKTTLRLAAPEPDAPVAPQRAWTRRGGRATEATSRAAVEAKAPPAVDAAPPPQASHAAAATSRAAAPVNSANALDDRQ